MSDWNADLYLKFKEQRTQPSIDLVRRVQDLEVRDVIDLGCGPGNSTAVLKTYFDKANITGLDYSSNMIAKARKRYPDLNFIQGDVTSFEGSYDLIFSNACLQWVGNHEALIPALMEHLNEGGVLAVQIPINQEEPLFKIIREAASDTKWHFDHLEVHPDEVLSASSYYTLLSTCSSEYDIWETIYYHSMPSHQALLEWVKGTRLRPYLNALPNNEQELFQLDILTKAKKVYPIERNGSILFRFKRLFFIAKK